MNLDEKKIEFQKIMDSHEYKSSLGLMSQDSVRKYLSLGNNTIYKWTKKWKAKQAEAELEAGRGEREFQEYLEHIRKLAFQEDSAPKYKEIYENLKGWNRKSNEATAGENDFTASEYATIARNVIQKLKAEPGRGVCPLLSQPCPLYDELCVDTQREHITESEVATVGIPTGLAEDTATVPGN